MRFVTSTQVFPCFASHASVSRTGARLGEAALRVELLGEGLEIDVGRVHLGVDLLARLLADVAVGDEDRLEPAGVRRARDVDRVLGPDGRVVVGEGERRARRTRRRGPPPASGRPRGRARRRPGAPSRCPSSGRTCSRGCSRRSRRRGGGAGEEVVQRLLLDRIDREAGGPAPAGGDELPAAVLPDEAEAVLPLADPASARAEGAAAPSRRRPAPSSAPRGARSDPNAARAQENTRPAKGLSGPGWRAPDAPVAPGRRRPLARWTSLCYYGRGSAWRGPFSYLAGLRHT